MDREKPFPYDGEVFLGWDCEGQGQVSTYQPHMAITRRIDTCGETRRSQFIMPSPSKWCKLLCHPKLCMLTHSIYISPNVCHLVVGVQFEIKI